MMKEKMMKEKWFNKVNFPRKPIINKIGIVLGVLLVIIGIFGWLPSCSDGGRESEQTGQTGYLHSGQPFDIVKNKDTLC